MLIKYCKTSEFTAIPDNCFGITLSLFLSCMCWRFGVLCVSFVLSCVPYSEIDSAAASG